MGLTVLQKNLKALENLSPGLVERLERVSINGKNIEVFAGFAALAELKLPQSLFTFANGTNFNKKRGKPRYRRYPKSSLSSCSSPEKSLLAFRSLTYLNPTLQFSDSVCGQAQNVVGCSQHLNRN